VLLSTREPDAWYRSASNTIFQPIAGAPPGLEQWFGTTIHKMFEERFSDDLENPTKMMEAFERHNAEVRAGIPADRLLSGRCLTAGSRSASGWAWPSRTRHSPATNSTNETRAILGMPAV
jgi:hypothetical protein